LGGLLAVLRHPSLLDVKGHLGLNAGAGVEVLATEGVTDPKLYEKVMARA
jgi:hypothetical protein